MTNHTAVVKTMITKRESVEPQKLGIAQGTGGRGRIDLVRKEK